jgi:hypothetical protein
MLPVSETTLAFAVLITGVVLGLVIINRDLIFKR